MIPLSGGLFVLYSLNFSSVVLVSQPFGSMSIAFGVVNVVGFENGVGPAGRPLWPVMVSGAVGYARQVPGGV